MATKKEQALAKKAEEQTALATGGFDYGEDAGSGWENTSQEDFTIPFLSIIQAMSPQVQETDAEFIEGAKAGMLMNTATSELFSGKDGVEFVPCFTEHKYVEWKNRQKDGGGFVAVHDCDSEIVREAKAASTQFGKYTVPVPEGVDHDLVETFYLYGLLVKGDEVVTPCMISFSSTKIKAYKGALTPLRQMEGRPPLFAFRLRITTVAEKNAKGTFHNFKIVPANGNPVDSLIAPDDKIFQTAKAFKDQVASGSAKVDHTGGATGDDQGSDADSPF